MNERHRFGLSLGVAVLAAAGGFAASPAAVAQAPAVETLTLKRAIDLALERAPQLAAMRASSEEAEASARVAADAFHPSVWVSTTPGYSTGLPVAVAGSVPAYGAIEIRQTIYDPWKKNEALAAEATAARQIGKLESSCTETVRSTVAAYTRSWTDERRADAGRRRLAAAEAAAARESALLEEGRATEMDVERAKLQAARAKQKLLNAESDRDLDGLELKRLIGWPGNAPLRLSSETDGALVGADDVDTLSAARSSDPQLKSLGRQIELLGRSAQLSAKRWPLVQAAAEYQRLPSYYSKYYNSFNENAFSFGVSFSIPLYAGGLLDDTEARSRAGLARAEAEREIREGDLEIAARRAEASVAKAEAERSLARRAQGIAEQDLRAAELLAREGRAEAGMVEERQLALADADEEVATATLGALEERVKLLALRGDLTRTLLGAEPPCAVKPGS